MYLSNENTLKLYHDLYMMYFYKTNWSHCSCNTSCKSETHFKTSMFMEYL